MFLNKNSVFLMSSALVLTLSAFVPEGVAMDEDAGNNNNNPTIKSTHPRDPFSKNNEEGKLSSSAQTAPQKSDAFQDLDYDTVVSRANAGDREAQDAFMKHLGAGRLCIGPLNLLSFIKDLLNGGEFLERISSVPFYSYIFIYFLDPEENESIDREWASEKQNQILAKLHALIADESLSQEIKAEAMTNLGELYHDGLGVTKNYEEAKKWYENAAELGDARAMNVLGLMYELGRGVPQNYVKAKEWYKKAVALGDAGAMHALGTMYELGRGVSQDYKKAKELYENAAELGDAQAMAGLGALYFQGIGVIQDYKMAKMLFEKGVALGSATAMCDLGVLYCEGLGVDQDYGKAKEWYEKAVALGNIAVMNNLGRLYQNGWGVAQDYGKAKEWYENAAELGSAEAKTNLATLMQAIAHRAFGKISGDPSRNPSARSQVASPVTKKKTKEAYLADLNNQNIPLGERFSALEGAVESKALERDDGRVVGVLQSIFEDTKNSQADRKKALSLLSEGKRRQFLKDLEKKEKGLNERKDQLKKAKKKVSPEDEARLSQLGELIQLFKEAIKSLEAQDSNNNNNTVTSTTTSTTTSVVSGSASLTVNKKAAEKAKKAEAEALKKKQEEEKAAAKAAEKAKKAEAEALKKKQEEEKAAEKAAAKKAEKAKKAAEAAAKEAADAEKAKAELEAKAQNLAALEQEKVKAEDEARKARHAQQTAQRQLLRYGPLGGATPSTPLGFFVRAVKGSLAETAQRVQSAWGHDDSSDSDSAPSSTDSSRSSSRRNSMNFGVNPLSNNNNNSDSDNDALVRPGMKNTQFEVSYPASLKTQIRGLLDPDNSDVTAKKFRQLVEQLRVDPTATRSQRHSMVGEKFRDETGEYTKYEVKTSKGVRLVYTVKGTQVIILEIGNIHKG